MIRAVLFDMYRTLGEDIDHPSFIDTLLAHGLSLIDAERVVRVADTDAFDGAEHHEASADRDAYDTWRRTHLLAVLEDVGVDVRLAVMIADQYGDWKTGMVKTFRPYPETRSVLQHLRTDGYIVAVCSNWDWDIDHIVHDLHISDVVDHVFTSAQLGVRKPHRAFFTRILRKLDVLPSEALFVGDTWTTDVVGGLDAGMRVAWVDRLHRPQPEQSDRVRRVENLRGVLGLLKE